MSINVVARKLLWGRAGNQCAWPSCNQRLTVVANDEEAGILQVQGLVIGEEAHIRSSRVDGPRHDASYSPQLLDSYQNLVLLCPTHHTVIDKEHGEGWPTQKVETIKADHEQRVELARGQEDRRRQQVEERLVLQLALWEEKLGLAHEDEWSRFSFGLNLPVPSIQEDRVDRLVTLGQWLLSRIWPPEFPRLQAAFERHLGAVRVLIQAINAYMSNDGPGRLEMDRPYKFLDRWDPPEYTRLLRETNVRAVTIWFLVCEMGRSANLVIQAAREEVDPLYRFDEGMLLNSDGDGVLSRKFVREEYSSWDWNAPAEFPTLGAIRQAILQAAGADDSTVEEVDPRCIRPH